MTVKEKAAQLLRKWADKLNPRLDYLDYREMGIPQLKPIQSDIQTLAVQIKYSASMYLRYGRRIDKYIEDEMISKMIQELREKKLIAITFDRGLNEVTYTGTIKVLVPNE